MIVLGIAWGVGATPTVTQVEAAPPAISCPSNVCQTATGPVSIGPGPRARLAVHNHSGQAVFVVMVFLDARDGKVLNRSRGEVLEPSQGTHFEVEIVRDARERIEIIGGLRISYIREPEGTVDATLQVFDAETGRIMVYQPKPRPGPLTREDWRIEAENYAEAAAKWNVETAPEGGAGPPR